jgi:hypothetical protein
VIKCYSESFDQLRSVVRKGVLYGVIQRVHLWIDVEPTASDPFLKQIKDTGHTKSDEICVALDMCESDIVQRLDELQTESEPAEFTRYFI